MKRFRRGEIQFLICTDLLARGIDIPNMNFVVNFDVPYSKDKDGFPVAEKETYLHRIGRTGWFDTKGFAITLINELEEENEMGVLNEIIEEYKADIQEIKDIREIKDLYQNHVVAGNYKKKEEEKKED